MKYDNYNSAALIVLKLFNGIQNKSERYKYKFPGLSLTFTCLILITTNITKVNLIRIHLIYIHKDHCI